MFLFVCVSFKYYNLSPFRDDYGCEKLSVICLYVLPRARLLALFLSGLSRSDERCAVNV